MKTTVEIRLSDCGAAFTSDAMDIFSSIAKEAIMRGIDVRTYHDNRCCETVMELRGDARVIQKARDRFLPAKAAELPAGTNK